MRPQRRQPTRLPRPWDSPGKNTGVGCHFLLQCMKVKSESEVPQSFPTLSDPMDCSLTGSSVHGIFQARVLKWGAIAFSTDSYKTPHSSVQFSSVAQSCPTLSDPMNCSTPGLPVHHQLPESTQTHAHRVDDTIQPSHSLSSLLLLPSIFPSIRVFSNQSTLCIRWPKYWTFSFSISPSNEHPGLISFRMDWLDLLVVQGTLKSLLQHHSSKASILQRSAFFIVQLSHPYMTTRKTIVKP